MADDAARRVLARLARSDEARTPSEDAAPSATEARYRSTIARATEALEDLDEAATFLDETGLDELEAAVERAERSVSACAADGRDALAAYRELRAAAAGEQFHPGRGTSLGGGDIGPSK